MALLVMLTALPWASGRAIRSSTTINDSEASSAANTAAAKEEDVALVGLQEQLAAAIDSSSSSVGADSNIGEGGLVWHNLQVSTDDNPPDTTADDSSTILQSFSFHIRRGQLTGLLGASGSGK